MHAALLTTLFVSVLPPEFPAFDRQEIDPHAGNVVYALTVADVNGDGKPDVCALTEDAIVWYANPTWEKHVILKGATERDNVTFQAFDLTRNGRIDFALGAGWNPRDTNTDAPIEWAEQAAEGAWKLHPIGGEPTVHRLRFGHVKGEIRPNLVVVPLQGRSTGGPNWGQGQGVRILVYSIPDDPTKDPWPLEVADDSLHTVHNFQLYDWDGDGREEILAAAWEGVFLLQRDDQGKWSRTQIGTGNQETEPFKGASEIKVGHLRDGRKYIATIEPWHGHQVVVYTAPDSGEGLWTRRVIDEPISWGHAIWVADLDGDGDEELIIGQRDPNKEPSDNPVGPGVWVYDPIAGTWPVEFQRHNIDDGGVAVEDALAADLNGNGRPEIIAGGRASHNVVIYWNQGADGS
ncbi:VCBS repeat-containing protein [soil metagenome]